MIGDALLAQKMAKERWIMEFMSLGFLNIVVPEGKAHIRTQTSAAHTRQQLDHYISALIMVDKELRII